MVESNISIDQIFSQKSPVSEETRDLFQGINTIASIRSFLSDPHPKIVLI